MKIFIPLFCLLAFILDIKTAKGRLVMVINIIRHGARTPLKNWTIFRKYFPTVSQGQITTNGWRQEILLGKYMRHKYVSNKFNDEYKDFINLDNLHEEFLLISSPTQRTIDSAIGYSLGLFPDHIFRITDSNYENHKNEDIPPIHGYSSYTPHYHFLIGSKNSDKLFHGSKCVFPDHVDLGPDDNVKKNSFLNETEKILVQNFFKNVFPNTTIFNDKNDEKVFKSMYNSLRALNYQFKEEIILVPKTIELILNRLVVLEMYKKKINNDNLVKLMNSEFFEHVINAFDIMIENHANKNEKKEITINNITLSNLKFLSFVGHDSNLIGFIKNLLDEELLEDYILNQIDNPEIFWFLMPMFGSMFEMQLIENNGEFYVKLFLNGLANFHKLRNKISYDTLRGIPYSKFRSLIQSRLFPDSKHCIMKKKNKDN